jgi:hypothetical protein
LKGKRDKNRRADGRKKKKTKKAWYGLKK